ncbi:cardiolipin synthase [Mangrovibrevibacter kandeliae]|uniref:cardiolipin synthase n=1 Tax=Mangrovibrevibacter kandeliae TaxID=2968473 RepID=UPI00211750E2|nr:cardiolipin synthase [Aurantimonas sp. CSK15Z-1]MCQ8781464.1 cardiolipin synthase [Aurantimonas sp. CSK15Z-1]
MDIPSEVLGWSWFAAEWAIRLAAVVIVPYYRSPDAAKGWLLLFFVAPLPAVLLYFAIGRSRHPRWRRKRVKALPDVIHRAMRDADAAIKKELAELPAELTRAAHLAEAIGSLPSLGGNAVELEPRYEAAVRRLIADIDKAEHHVHLLYYIFADDEIGGAVLEALVRATDRGVTCRLLIDAFGSRRFRKGIEKRLKGTSVEMRIVLPFRFWNRATRADLRNHRKIVVIDGRIGWVGSQNLIKAESEPGLVNRELVARVTGPCVAMLQTTYIGDWFLETLERIDGPELFPRPLPHCGETVTQLLPSGPDYPDGRIDDVFTALIHGARERVAIVTPYFIPNEALLTALRTAALRGVDTHLIVSARTDNKLVDLAERSYFAGLIDAGVQVDLFKPKFLHAKHLSIDNRIGLIGSSNVDMRSFELNSEISLIVYSREFTLRLRQIEDEYLATSDRLDRERWNARPRLQQVVENIARLISPLL